MISNTRRTLPPGRILALSRQGQRWWPHSDSPSHANTFRESASAPSLRLGNIPTVVAVPLAAAGIASVISSREAPTYVLQAPLQAAVTTPAMATATQSTTVVEPIAHRDARSGDFAVPFAEPVDQLETVPVTAAATISEMSLPEREIALATGDTTVASESTVPTFVDPFSDLDLAQTVAPPHLPADSGPSSGLLPDLDDPIAMRNPEILSIKEIVDAPQDQSLQTKLEQYQKEFPEIFVISNSGGSNSARTPFTSGSDQANRRRAREAVERAEEWRAQRGSSSNQRRRHGILGKLRTLFRARS